MKTGFLTRNILAAFGWLPKALLASPFVFAAALGAPQAAAQIATGTVMVSTGNGRVTEFTQTGTIVTQINTTTGSLNTTGSAFDSAGNFFVTDFQAQALSKFDPTGVLVAANFAGPFNADPESIVFDASGNFYVGQASGTKHILKFAPSGTLLATFAPATESGGTNWIQLGADQCTLYYTSRGKDVLTFNACTNIQGPNFNKVPLPGGVAFALRLLPAGGMLVADNDFIVRLDASGNQIETYHLPAINLFALSLDPDGTSFWTADPVHVFKVDINSGALLQNWFATGEPNFVGVGGLAVKGEIIVSNLPTCSSGDAILVNEKFVSPTLTYDISSPTRVMTSISIVSTTNIASSTLPTIDGTGHKATGGSFTKADPTKRATFTLQVNSGPAFACTIDPTIKKGHKDTDRFLNNKD